DGVPELLETVGDPFALGRGLDQHAGRRAPSQHLSKSLMLGSDASFLVVATLGADADLAVDLVDVDSDVFHPSAPSSPAWRGVSQNLAPREAGGHFIQSNVTAEWDDRAILPDAEAGMRVAAAL